VARRKTPDNETAEQKQERLIKEAIANGPSRSDKVSWNRKMDNMVKLMTKLSPIEEEIIALQAKKIPIFDEIQQLRETMVAECVHPYEYLVVNDDHILCKFCGKRLSKPNVDE
jgi:hypothetical protein